MPHISSRHRKPTQHQTKLTTSSSSDGWSHVIRKGGSAAATHTRIPNGTTYSNAELVELLTPAQLTYLHNKQRRNVAYGDKTNLTEDNLGPKPQPPRCSEEELRKRLERVRQEWRDCGMDGKVKRMFESADLLGFNARAEVEDGGTESVENENKDTIRQDAEGAMARKLHQLTVQEEPVAIHKIICLGLGSPSADPSGWRNIVLWQLVAFLAIAEICMYTSHSSKVNSPLRISIQFLAYLFYVVILVQPSKSSTLKLYAQDPVFNTLDTSFLSSLQITVIPTPSAFPLIDKDALVYAPHYPIACWPTQMRQGLTKCIIGNDVATALANGRILGEKNLLSLFSEDAKGTEASNGSSELTVPLKGQDGAPLNAAGIPDLHAKTELEDFKTQMERVTWPEPGGGFAEGAFNDTFVYWMRIIA